MTAMFHRQDGPYSQVSEQWQLLLPEPSWLPGKSLPYLPWKPTSKASGSFSEGLARKSWRKIKKRPVLHLDLNIGKYDTLDSLDKILDKCPLAMGSNLRHGDSGNHLALRFKGILERAYKQTSERAGTALPERALHCLQTGRFLYPGRISYVRRTD